MEPLDVTPFCRVLTQILGPFGLDPLSGRRDSNSRPPAPKAGILTGLNYYP